MTGVLDEAYERLRFAGPEWGEDVLTNHGPMAVEAMVRRGHAARVHHWLDGYLRRLDDMPSASSPISADTWRSALGDGRRIGDWTLFFEREVASRAWRPVLAEWWPRLLPGIVAGATHGVIRVGHAVNALLGSSAPADADSPAVTELAHGLAFWAARWRPVPGAVPAAGRLDAGTALTGVPRLKDQNGQVAVRLAQLPDLPGWAAAVGALRAPTTPDETRAALRDLVAAGTLIYLDHGQASPVLLVHVATAPNAVLRTLPALPTDLWAPSLDAVWAASAALVCAYAPRSAPPGSSSAEPRPTAPADVSALLDLAVRHGDEHVIKLSDTAADVFAWTGDRTALASAVWAGALISL